MSKTSSNGLKVTVRVYLVLQLLTLCNALERINLNEEDLLRQWKSLKNFDVAQIDVRHDEQVVNSTSQTSMTDSSVNQGSKLKEVADFHFSDGQRPYSNEQKIQHMNNITLRIRIQGNTYTIDLKLNSRLFSSNYSEKLVDGNSEHFKSIDTMATNCYYTGNVIDHPGSVAAVSTCNGGIVGFFTVDNETYHIEPSTDQDRCISCRHRVYHSIEEDELLQTLKCGVDENSTRCV